MQPFSFFISRNIVQAGNPLRATGGCLAYEVIAGVLGETAHKINSLSLMK